MVLVRASPFCQPSRRQPDDERIIIHVFRPLRDQCDCYVSAAFLKKRHLFSDALVRLDDILVRVRLHEDFSHPDIIYITPTTAANLGLYDFHQGSARLSIRPREPSLCVRATLIAWGQQQPNTKLCLPTNGTILQLNRLVDMANDPNVYYQVVDLNQSSFSLVGPNTQFIIQSPEKAIWSPQLPPFLSYNTIDIPHPTVIPPVAHDATIDERIWHVIGTEREHHIQTCLQVHALQTGRSFLGIRGLAAYAARHLETVTTGGWNDKGAGLAHALEQAHRQAPCLLWLENIDDECHDSDDYERLQAMLKEGLTAPLSEQKHQGASCLRTTPSVLVVISTRQSTHTALQCSFVFSPIECSRPDKAYCRHLWSSVGPLDDVTFQKLDGMSAHEIVRISKQISDGMSLEKVIGEKRPENKSQIPSVHWEDVGGLAHVRHEIMDMITLPLKYPHMFPSGTGRSGILLYGPPGSGKTLVAKAVATECGIPFLSIKGPELLGSYVGESESNVRNVFANAMQLAHRNKPPACVCFFDELDSLSPFRGNADSGGNVLDRVVATLLTELDQSSSIEGASIFCIGATNRPDLLDSALLRPGRLDRLVYLGVSSDKLEQASILQAQLRRVQVEGDIRVLAQQVVEQLPPGLTGADLSSLATDAVLRATERLCQEADQLLQEGVGGHETIDNLLATWGEDKLQPLITLNDLLEAAKCITPSVSVLDLEKYRCLQDMFTARKD